MGIGRLARSWPTRVAVRGHSMEPTLRDGDWLLVDPDAYRLREPTAGELILAETLTGLVVKRVVGALTDGSLLLAGDAPSSAEHRHEVRVPPVAVAGQPWFRYWPLRRVGRIG